MNWLLENLPINIKTNGAAILMLQGLIYFCLAVENGTIQSKEIYEKYISLIETLTFLDWSEINKHVSIEDVE